MNIEKNLSLIQSRFRNLKPVGTDLFRAERKSNGFTIGVFYFDFGQPLRKTNFKLNEYLQQVIATDFYQHEGSLQLYKAATHGPVRLARAAFPTVATF